MGTRRETLRQLCAIALAAGDPASGAEGVYFWLEKKKDPLPDDPRMRVRRAARPQGLLHAVHPLAVGVLVETLPLLPKGAEYLARIVDDGDEDPMVRCRALFELTGIGAALSAAERHVDWNKDPTVVVENALRALARSDRGKALPVARKLVQEYLRAVPKPGLRGIRGIGGSRPVGRDLTPHQRFLVGLSLQILGQAGEAKRGDLVEVIERELPRRIRLEEERKRPAEPSEEKQTVRPGLWMAEFDSPDELLETALIELGRLGDPAALSTILRVLRERRAPGRAEACLALGAVRTPAAVDALVESLDDADGWVRFMAYRVLKALSGKDHSCDWIYGSESERKVAVDAWKAWAASMHPERNAEEEY